jgi:hypothetical protein
VADDKQFELAQGWYGAETWPEGSGRWSSSDATLILARQAAEQTLLVTLISPPGRATLGQIQVNGITLATIPYTPGSHEISLDLAQVRGDLIFVRFVIQTTFVPAALDPTTRDKRVLGVFVRSAQLR